MEEKITEKEKRYEELKSNLLFHKKELEMYQRLKLKKHIKREEEQIAIIELEIELLDF